MWQGSRHYKSFPQHNGKRGEVRKSHWRNSQEEKFSIIVNLTRASEGVSRQPIGTSFAGEWKEPPLLVDWASTSGKYCIPNGLWHQHWRRLWEHGLRRCPHPQEVVHQPWVMKVILIGVKAWKDDSKKASGKYKPCSKKQGDSKKKMTCLESRFHL